MDSDKLARAVSKLKERAESTQLNLVVVGKAGQGKSTLVNNLLGFAEGEEDAAKSGGIGLTQTKNVKMHSNKRDNAVVNVWDTPGLFDNTHVKQEKILSQLISLTHNRMDLVLICIAYTPGIRVDDSHGSVIATMTKMFGKELWNHALFVMTFVNTAPREKSSRERHKKLLENVEKELKGTLAEALQSLSKCSKDDAGEIAGRVPFLTAGNKSEILPHEKEEWNGKLLFHCLEKINPDFVPTILQVRYGEAIWHEVGRVAGWTVAGAAGGGLAGGAGGTAAGAGIGALIGLAGGPPGVAVGAWLGAIGAIVGAGGVGTSAGVVGVVKGYKNTKEIREVQKEIEKIEEERKKAKK